MDVFTTCFHCISFTEFEKPAKRVFSEELWITCVWTEPRLRDTPVRVSRNPHIRVISLPLHVNKTNLASRSFLFLLSNRVKDERLQLREWEILIEQTLRRSDWREWHSRKEREWDYLLSLTPPRSLSLCAVTSLSGSVHTPALAPCLFTHALGFMVHTHTYCLSLLTWLLVLIVHIKEEELECGRDCKIFLDWVSWCVCVHTRVGKEITTAAALVHEARIKKKKWL